MEAESESEVLRRAQSRLSGRMSSALAGSASPSSSYDASSVTPNNDILAIARQQLRAEKMLVGSARRRDATRVDDRCVRDVTWRSMWQVFHISVLHSYDVYIYFSSDNKNNEFVSVKKRKMALKMVKSMRKKITFW